MGYGLCIWDPDRHGPLPTTAKAALATMERLSAVPDTWELTLLDFADKLIAQYAADPQVRHGTDDCTAFWGKDPRKTALACQSAVYRLSIPTDACIRQISYAVAAAAELGLIVFDDEDGTCFLPDGSIFPEDMRDIWVSDLADMRAGPGDPNLPDGRTFWERLGGELFDAIGRGNKRS